MAVSEADFATVFEHLKNILKPYEGEMLVVHDAPGDYYLNTPVFDKKKRPVFFGAVRTGKRYVSFHFMPLYIFPELVDDLSAGLRKRMQGKSCFNFTKPDDAAFEELAALTSRGLDRMKQEGVA